MLYGNARVERLPRVGAMKVKVRLARRLSARKQFIRIFIPLAESCNHFRPDFQATPGCCRAERDEQVFGARIPLKLHAFNRSCEDARKRASPARVHRRKCARARVGDERRHAIGRLYAEHNARRVRRERVAFGRIGLRIANIAYCAHIGRMDLARSNERPVRSVEGGKEPAAVFNDVRPLVLAEISQAQGSFGQWADAARPRAECVTKTG